MAVECSHLILKGHAVSLLPYFQTVQLYLSRLHSVKADGVMERLEERRQSDGGDRGCEGPDS